jgi:cyclophilin family peptidyl-prolyl cis-trans isomerase/HEAT repeat protein
MLTMRSRLVLLHCLLASCATDPVQPAQQPAPIALDTTPALLEIARLEDARVEDPSRLVELLSDSEPKVRERAALALGRMPRAADSEAVARALTQIAASDASVDVRCAALFALGQRDETASGEALIGLTKDPEPQVRARAVEALAKLSRPELRTIVLHALQDDDPHVRLEAAHGPYRWPRDEPGADDVDRQIAAQLERESDHDVIVYALHTLERRKASAGRAAFQHFAAAPDSELRLFAVRGLKALPADGLLLDELIHALSDLDWRVACEAALGLAAYDAPSATKALGEATKHLSPHVRRCAWEALATHVERADELTEAKDLHASLRPYWMQRAAFESEPSLSVRAAYQEVELPLLVKLRSLDDGWSAGQTQELLLRLDEVVKREPPIVLVGLARALGRIREGFATQMLSELARSSDRLVAEAAIEGLGKHPSDEVRAQLLELLVHADNGIRLAALDALGTQLKPEDAPRLLELYRTSQGEIGAELRFNTVRAAQKLSPDAPSAVAEAALADPDRFVRRVAKDAYAALKAEPPATDAPLETLAPPPIPGTDYPLYDYNPQVQIETTQGTLVFELFPAEAPVHVQSFLELARRGVFDGLSFHRVVPDFVVQGGDPRGDGNGGASWRGGALRNEIGPRKYVRGSFGMPRNDDPDSGGGQLFVTHRRTPHLDGRYTIFGELVAGGSVLDALEVGDRILSVRVP